MKFLLCKDIRYFFFSVLAVLMLLLLSGFIFSQNIANDFKSQMITHDGKAAGYLLEHDVGASDIAAAFTSRGTDSQFSSGKSFLRKIGYDANTGSGLLPDVTALLNRYRLIFMLAVLLFGAFLLCAFFIYFYRRQKAIEKANASIDAFMSGNTAVRLDSEDEGGLSLLFYSVNKMATSLSAHLEAEKHTKEFLKNTISDISHQLKTPLASLKMYNEIIEEESGGSDTVRKFSQKSAGALERMDILIKNLLKIAKFDSGTVELNKRKINIKNIMEDVISAFETRAEREQKIITQNGSGSAVLFCDEDWLTEAIGNLVKNALDHTKAGGQICIEWKETPVITQIIIKDNGVGIHPEDIHHIFKRFYRSRFSNDKQGVGLGLSLAKSIVEAHNGTITAESIMGKGSVFTLDFLKLSNL
jgi:signal transduction histidine kinase